MARAIQEPNYITIEKISSGFLLIDHKGRKSHRQTLNGLIKFLEEHWNIKYIKLENEELATPIPSKTAKKLTHEN